MIYEMRIYNLKPRGVAEFERNFAKVIEKRQKYSRMAGFFHCEIGDVNRVMHIWEYKDMNHRARVRKETMKKPWWPPKVVHLLVAQTSKILTPAPFFPKPRVGRLGSVYEFRTYTIRPGKMPEVFKRYPKSLKGREKLSPLAACFSTEAGALNQFIHVYPYEDLNHRMETRAAASKLKNWPPPTAPFIVHQNTEIWLPAEFSPMH